MSSPLVARLNPGIAALSPYEPGKPVEELRRELGLDSIIKLASNENPLGPAPSVQQLLHNWQGRPERYPDGNGFALKQRLAQEHAIDADRITLGNGSNDILELAARLFLGPGRTALFSQYGFAVYRLVTLAANGVCHEVPALPAQGEMPLGHDLQGFVAAIDETVRVIYIATPNNPTGTWTSPREIEQLLDVVPRDVLVVLDEAYREYQQETLRPASREWLERYPNLLVTRTFSKVHALAGLRVGYGLSSPAVADMLNRVRQPFNVNALAQACAIAALDASTHVQAAVALNTLERDRLRQTLQALDLTVLPSEANFLSFACGRASSPVFQALLRAGVIVRPLAGYAMPDYLRVTVGMPDENNRFANALEQALAAT